MKQRSIFFMIFMSTITLGIYLIYWNVSFQNNLQQETGEGFSGAGHFFASLFSLGIYLIVWQYKAGKRLAMLGAEDHSTIYSLLAYTAALSWLNPLLMQSQANNLYSRR